VRHLQATKSQRAAKDAEARLKNHVLNNTKLAATELTKLAPAQLEAWRKSLRERPTRSGGRRGEQRSDSTLNRDMTCFRAALNLAYLDGLLTTDFAWRSKLRPIKNADQRRELYLDRAHASSSSRRRRPISLPSCVACASSRCGQGPWPSSRPATSTDG
jgi:hypothetical protein